MTDPDIDGGRLWSDLMTLGAIGGTAAGGCFRPALSETDAAARALFRLWAEEAGMIVTTDAIGNIFARRTGSEDLPPVMIGSHLDTQMPGGRFDGVLGVVAGLVVVRALNAAGITTRHPIEVVNWTNEEGARFQPGVMGSAVFAGLLPLEEALSRTDRDGTRLSDELARNGIAGPVPAAPRPVHRYLELHIEQGPLLEAEATDIGLVTHSTFMCSGFVDIHGANAHAQIEAMGQRRNALLAAARLILAIEEVGAAVDPAGRVSATVIENWPNNRVNIPHLTKLTYMAVHDTAEGLADINARIRAAADAIAEATRTRIDIAPSHLRQATVFPADLRKRAADVAGGRGLTVREMMTLTAHDALSLAHLCPSALIFVPCRDGISHAEGEWCEPHWAANGARLLLGLALDQADRITEVNI
ncbi:hydantoinase/carbamoylase family amidase [Falsirhodobacter deserti]|uniref:hydantoinase/carbamoylase family amidase n=1 Tax=Falsirhodobacter deserti TaxID=1365611 RepID=UPI0013E2E013|nr:hydantoinase/carbamoylase family amidase [Falsirhodobacter deserti]